MPLKPRLCPGINLNLARRSKNTPTPFRVEVFYSGNPVIGAMAYSMTSVSALASAGFSVDPAGSSVASGFSVASSSTVSVSGSSPSAGFSTVSSTFVVGEMSSAFVAG